LFLLSLRRSDPVRSIGVMPRLRQGQSVPDVMPGRRAGHPEKDGTIENVRVGMAGTSPAMTAQFADHALAR
jgi:hypothetical protein